MATPSEDRDADGGDPTGEPGGRGRGRALRLGAVVVVSVALGVVLGVALLGSGDGATAPEAAEVGDRTRSAEPSATDAGDGPDAPSVTLEQLDGTGAVRILVADPAAPTAAGQATGVCVLVTYTTADVADEPGPGQQVHGCAEPGGSAELTMDPSTALVGCAAVADRQSPVADGSTAASATFTVIPAAPLRAGSYEVSVEATTGYGDGCPPADDQGEHVLAGSFGTEVG